MWTVCSKISFISKYFVVTKVLLLSFSHGSSPQVSLSDRHFDDDACLMLLYGGKKTRDVDLTCRCHLSNIMFDSIFYDSVFKGDNHCLSQHKRDGLSCLIIVTPMGLGKP